MPRGRRWEENVASATNVAHQHRPLQRLIAGDQFLSRPGSTSESDPSRGVSWEALSSR